MAALRDAGAEVLGMLAIFTYGFPVAANAFKEANVQLDTLSNYDDLIAEAVTRGYVSESDIEALKQWRQDPANWRK